MYVWVVIGNGFRYGTRFLYGSAGLALLSFYTVVYFSPHYKSDFGLLGLGTFLLGFVIPVYFGSLLRKLQQNLLAAREADRLKTRFLSNVSHDLRTPLNVIMANCDLLSRDPGNISRQSRRLQDMQKAATTLKGLVVDLLDVAKIEAGKVQISSSRFNFIELLGRIARFNRTSALAKGTQINLTVAPETPVQVNGDALRLEQILNNIVSNAVKYTDNGDVSIYARPAFDSRTGACDGIVCSVSDTGIGMETEALERIFSRFEQADLAYARHYAGAGLGLNIASELTVLMGGSIEVQSKKGEGSCFTLRVPLRPDSHFDFSTVSSFFQIPVTVICGGDNRRPYWGRLLEEITLPDAKIFTVEELASQSGTPSGELPESNVLLIDTCGLDTPIDEITSLIDSSSAGRHDPRILVGSSGTEDKGNQISKIYKRYRSWTAGAHLDDIRKALAIARWTTGSEPSNAETGGELRTWIESLRGLTVLVADDNELNRHVLSDMLAYADARAIEASNGADALSILSRESIDIALLDVQMPNMTGVEVMRAYAARAQGHSAPMIALTADTTEECRYQCLDAGARTILHKPVNMNTLYRALYRVMGVDQPTKLDRQRYTIDKPSRDLLDYALLRELAQTGRHPDYVDTLVSCFKRDGERLLTNLGEAFKLDNLVDSRSLLHRLKGMSGSIGACKMASACQDGLALSDTELSAAANRLTSSLFELHTESAALLDTFSHAVAGNG
jgi:two-component system sensor histidine kinase RpfC